MLTALIGACIFVPEPAKASSADCSYGAQRSTPPLCFPSFAWSGRMNACCDTRHRAVNVVLGRFCVSADDIVYEDNEENSTVRRRKKKNKYAKFSKADRQEKDPFEAMVSDSIAKVKEIEKEKARKKNRSLPADEEEMWMKRQEKRERNKLIFPDTRTIDPYDPTTYGYTELGTIVGAHGVHGLLKVSAVTEFAERLCKPGVRHLKAYNRRSPREVQLLEGRHRLGNEYLVKIEGVGDRDAANKLRGSLLYALQTERPSEIGTDEYLISDLIGLDVFLEKGCGKNVGADLESDNIAVDDAGEGRSFVGKVSGILLGEDMSSVPGLGQDMLEIVLPRGRGGTPSWRDEMVLIPFVPQIVPTVDLDEGVIYIVPPPGLLDLTYVKEEKVRIKGLLPPAKEVIDTS